MTNSFILSLGKNSWTDLLAEIGSGKFGVVTDGEDRDGRHLAVKRLLCRSGNYMEKNDRMKTYLKDLTSWKPFNAKNVLQYLDYVNTYSNGNTTHWLVMDHCDEGNLCAYVKKHKTYLDQQEMLSLIMQSADGVNALHTSTPPIIHQWIKPQNILIKTEGQKHVVKISDYFMAQLFDGPQLSTANGGCGVHGEIKERDFFKGPEYFKNNSYPNEASYDVFCLGLVFLALAQYNEDSDKMIPILHDNPKMPIAKLMVDPKSEADDTKLLEKTNIHNCPVQAVIVEMLRSDETKRANTQKVIIDLKEIQAKCLEVRKKEKTPLSCDREMPSTFSGDQEFGLSFSQDKEISSPTNVPSSRDGDEIIQKVYRGFQELLIENGPLHYTDKLVRKHFKQLPEAEMDVVLAVGSIRDFLIGCGSIEISEEQILKYVDQGAPSISNSSELRKYYCSLNKHLDDKKELAKLVKSIYCSSRDGIIYVYVSKEAFQEVNRGLQLFNEYQLKVIVQEEMESELLVIPQYEKQTPTLLSCIGPGSLIANDPGLAKFDEMEQLEKNIFAVEEAFREKAWGSFGCLFADQNDIYVLSAKHILNKTGNDAENQIDIDYTSQTCMITGLKDDHNSVVTHGTTVQSTIQDCLYISKGFHGILDVSQEDALIDVALFGPLHKSFLSIHEINSVRENKRYKLSVLRKPHWMLDGKFVKKVGANTGLTKGIIIDANHKKTITVDNKDGTKRSITGKTFLVTSYDENTKHPERDGGFALKGDSGSLVLLDSPEMHAVGIVHGLYPVIKLGNDTYHNVIVCAHLDHNIDTLMERGKWNKWDLFYYYFKPILCLGTQKTEEKLSDVPNLAVSCDPRVNEVTEVNSCEYCTQGTQNKGRIQSLIPACCIL